MVTELRVHMSPEALQVCQVLLDHHASLKDAPRRPPFDRCLIEYGDLLAAAGMSHLMPKLDDYLDEIAEWCVTHGYPPIDSIAVSPATHEPQIGYIAGPGCELDGWLEDAQRCLDFDYYPRAVIS